MLKNVFKLTLATVVWKKYRTIIVATLLLLLYFWLVGQVHSDFITYSKVNSIDTSLLGTSFVLKWIALGIGCVFYSGFLWFRRRQRNLAPMAAKKFRNKAMPENTQTDTGEDPFRNIRKKRKLQTKTDKLIAGKPTSSN